MCRRSVLIADRCERWTQSQLDAPRIIIIILIYFIPLPFVSHHSHVLLLRLLPRAYHSGIIILPSSARQKVFFIKQKTTTTSMRRDTQTTGRQQTTIRNKYTDGKPSSSLARWVGILFRSSWRRRNIVEWMGKKLKSWTNRHWINTTTTIVISSIAENSLMELPLYS